MVRYANKERNLLLYGKGKDLYNREFHVQDGSWACFKGIRIYGHDSNNEGSEICLSLKVPGVKKLIKALQKSIEDPNDPHQQTQEAGEERA